MAILFDLSSVTAADADHVLAEGKIGTQTLAHLGATLSGNVITVPGYGTLDVTNAVQIKLTLSADAPAGTYDITGVALNGIITEIDASKMTNAFTLGTLDPAVELTALAKLTTGSGADVVTMNATETAFTSLNTGAGNDKVIISGKTAVGTSVTLGAGADTLDLTGADPAASLAVADYNYADGDVIKILDAETPTLGDTGALSFGTATKVSVKTAMADNQYKVTALNASNVTSEYWTAAANTAVTMDASGKTYAINIDARSAASANITGSATDDTITLGTGKTTLNVGLSVGNDTLQKADKSVGYTTDTTLNFVGGSVKKLSTSGTNALQYVNTTLTGALGTGADSVIEASFDGGTAKKIYLANKGAASTLDATSVTDADIYLGDSATANTTTLKVNTDTNLYNTDKYVNISHVVVDAAGAGMIIGNSNQATVIDGGSATHALNVWGGSSDVDTITLGIAGDAADTVWFGQADGKDVVNAFDGTFATTGDVLKLYDTTSLSNASVALDSASKKVLLTTGKNTVAVNTAGTTDEMKVMLSDGTVKKVALETTYAAGAADSIGAVGADIVLGNSKFAATNEVDYTGATDDLVVNLLDTNKYINVTNINMTGATGANNALIGSAAHASAITVASAGTNAIWGGNTDTNMIDLGASNHTATDTVWYGGSYDGADQVAGFNTANDTVKLYDATSATDVWNKYQFNVGTSTAIAYKAAAANKLTLTSLDTTTTKTIKLQLSDDTKMSALVGAADMTFATDTLIYSATKVGGVKVTAGAAITGTIIADLDNGNGGMNAGNYYFSSDITTFDASASSAKAVLIGRASAGSTLKGGLTENAFWGGGATSGVVMQGNNQAVDTFWFGTKDGIANANTVDKGDKVRLWDVNDINSAAMQLGTDQDMLVIGGSVLQIADTGHSALTGGLTFELATGAQYTYDTTKKQFVTKA